MVFNVKTTTTTTTIKMRDSRAAGAGTTTGRWQPTNCPFCEVPVPSATPFVERAVLSLCRCPTFKKESNLQKEGPFRRRVIFMKQVLFDEVGSASVFPIFFRHRRGKKNKTFFAPQSACKKSVFYQGSVESCKETLIFSQLSAPPIKPA